MARAYLDTYDKLLRTQRGLFLEEITQGEYPS